MANPNWNKNNKSITDSYIRANNFVQSYYNSEGFKLRLKKHKWNNYPNYETPDLILEARWGYYFMPKEYRTDVSNPTKNAINYGMYDDLDDGFQNKEYVLAHELGHNIDLLLSTNTKVRNYSESYPIFRQNTFLLALLSDSNYMDEWNIAKRHPNLLADKWHDMKPEESYSDLIALRDLLYRAGIYDSRKANNPFTKLHLEQFKKINPEYRLFNYFSDEDIITMMNEVAQNNALTLDKPLYAKQGTKIDVIERFRKYRKGGSVERFGGGNKTSAQKARENNTDSRKVDMSKVTSSDNLNRKADAEAYAQLLDSLIARNYPFPLRMAILGTSMLEGTPGSYGIGGGGYLGLSSERMPKSYLGNTPEQRAKQITFVLDDLERTHSNNWLDGGSGGIKINTGKDGYNLFWNTNDVDSATQVLNKSYVRPGSRQAAWDNRSKVAKTLSKKAK